MGHQSLYPETWTLNEEEIWLSRRVKTKTYRALIALLVEIAFLAEKDNHHPQMIVGFHEMTIKLRSFDVSAITERDYDLAWKIEKLL